MIYKYKYELDSDSDSGHVQGAQQCTLMIGQFFVKRKYIVSILVVLDDRDKPESVLYKLCVNCLKL